MLESVLLEKSDRLFQPCFPPETLPTTDEADRGAGGGGGGSVDAFT